MTADVIAFVKRIDHLSFTEAVEYLAGRAGVRLCYEESDGAVRHGVEPGTRRRLLEANRVAEDWFRSQLSRTNPLAAGAGRFLYSRGFDDDALERGQDIASAVSHSTAQIYAAFFVLEHLEEQKTLTNALKAKPEGTVFVFSVPTFGLTPPAALRTGY